MRTDAQLRRDVLYEMGTKSIIDTNRIDVEVRADSAVYRARKTRQGEPK